jgi:K+-sensing histidine kinase KdpD
VEVLLSTLVHEVKNPLVAISTFAHLLPERYEDGEFRGDFSRLMGMEVKRLNGVLEMLMDYGQMGAPRSDDTDILELIKKFWEEKKGTLGQKIVMDLKDSFSRASFDERQLNFVLERIADQIRSKAATGGEIRLTNREIVGQRKWVEMEMWYSGQEETISMGSRTGGNQGDWNFEGLSLPLGLARRIMRRNNGEMNVLKEKGMGTKILLRFPKQDSSQYTI